MLKHFSAWSSKSSYSHAASSDYSSPYLDASRTSITQLRPPVEETRPTISLFRLRALHHFFTISILRQCCCFAHCASQASFFLVVLNNFIFNLSFITIVIFNSSPLSTWYNHSCQLHYAAPLQGTSTWLNPTAITPRAAYWDPQVSLRAAWEMV